jgi:hypothetical protein
VIPFDENDICFQFCRPDDTLWDGGEPFSLRSMCLVAHVCILDAASSVIWYWGIFMKFSKYMSNLSYL